MSADLMDRVYKIRDERLSPGDRYVLLTYAYHVNQRSGTQQCWASAQTIADETGYSPDGVSRAVSRLRGFGYLERVGKRAFGRGIWTWIYRVDLDAAAAKDPTYGRNLNPDDALKEPTNDRLGSAPRSDKPDVEPEVKDLTEPNGSAQTLLAEWIDHCSPRPPRRVVGHVSKELKIMLDDGLPYETVRAGLAAWHRGRWNPSALASVVHTTALGPAEKLSTADQRVISGAALIAKLEAEDGAALRPPARALTSS